MVAGLSIKNLHPRVWDAESPFHLPKLRAVMVSYGEAVQWPTGKRGIEARGLRAWLGAPPRVRIFLDNGSFYFLTRRGGGGGDFGDYERFVAGARPDWHPIPRDYIPAPKMSPRQQREAMDRTMGVNRAYEHDGFVPVVHVGANLEAYVRELRANDALAAKPRVALGGIVPNLLRAPKAMGYDALLGHLRHVRATLDGKDLHVFGIGGTATLHLAALLGIDSVDSSGWRNRAARGLVQLPGSGDRMVAELGNWRGRRPSPAEWEALEACPCPACRAGGLDGLKAKQIAGFSHRATHNLWVLLEEAEWVRDRLADGTYAATYRERLDNSTYLRLIKRVLETSAQPCRARAPEHSRPPRAATTIERANHSASAPGARGSAGGAEACAPR